MKIQKSDLREGESNAAAARRLGVNPSTITHARKRFNLPASPLTKRKLEPEVKARMEKTKLERSYAYRKQLHGAIDWRMTNLEISIRFGVSAVQVSRWRIESKVKTWQYSKRDYILRIIEQEAKLSERKTVHEWLNEAGVAREENGKPLCLLRRLSLALGRTEPFQPGESVPVGTYPQ